MASRWDDHALQRPDRYLDWEFANRPADDREQRWCAVLVQIAVGPPSDPALHLKYVKTSINDQPTNQPGIRIHADEFELLDTMIREVELRRYQPEGEDDVGFQFFVYLPENLAYLHTGDYAHSPHYRIRLVGPPVVRNVLKESTQGDEESIERDVSTFQPLGPAANPRVAIGIIDDGLAFAHQHFRTRTDEGGRTSERTRIQAIWLQEIEKTDPSNSRGITFGKRLMKGAIDTLLQKSAEALGYVDDNKVYRQAGLLDFGMSTFKPLARRVAHGTHVMDLAAGFDCKAPGGLDRPILAVQLPAVVTADTSGATMGTYVLQGLRQIMLWADKLDNGRPMPLVVNFSYGIMAGPKDGSHILEAEIDRLVEHRRCRKKTPTAVVLPAGNSFGSRTTAFMRLEPRRCNQIDWVVLPDDRTPSFLEIWCDRLGASPLAVTVTPPHTSALPEVTAIEGKSLHLKDEGRLIAGIYGDIVERRPDGRTKTRVFVAINPTSCLDGTRATAPAGHWHITITNTTYDTLDVLLFIQRDDTPAGFRLKGRQSYFYHPRAYERDAETGNYDHLGNSPITHSYTLSAIGNGTTTVLTGAALDEDVIRPADYTSSGPTPRRKGPDFCSLGDEGRAHVGVLAAGSLTGSTIAQRGSSVAAPQVARRLADVGASVEALKAQYHAQDEEDARLGFAFVPRTTRPNLPPRRRSSRRNIASKKA